MLEPRVAVQMALVLHELADNARRHGALGQLAGRLTVAWRIEAGPPGTAAGAGLARAWPGCPCLAGVPPRVAVSC